MKGQEGAQDQNEITVQCDLFLQNDYDEIYRLS
jgi:hypothetical protein